MKKRFRGFLPVVVDVETGGINPATDALLEIAVVFLQIDNKGTWSRANTISYHVEAFEGAVLNPEAMAINQIDPTHPFRLAVPEKEALTEIFAEIKKAVKAASCQRAVLVGHNAWFDLLFVKAAAERCDFKNIPFHAFTSLDTATMAGLVFGETVLVKAAHAAGIKFNQKEAHSAIYDAEKTADLFCNMVNRFPLEIPNNY